MHHRTFPDHSSCAHRNNAHTMNTHTHSKQNNSVKLQCQFAKISSHHNRSSYSRFGVQFDAIKMEINRMWPRFNEHISAHGMAVVFVCVCVVASRRYTHCKQRSRQPVAVLPVKATASSRTPNPST